MLTSDQLTALDRNAAALGVSQKQLMESGGNAVARAVRERTAAGDSVTIVAGRGNNGGDGFAAARFLSDRSVTVLLLGREELIRSEIAADNWRALQNSDFETHEITDGTALTAPPAQDAIESATVLVDAMLGTGITGALREPTATAARQLNQASGTILAIDVPSGVDPDTGTTNGPAVNADHVVTFHDRTPGLAKIEATVSIADIGIPDAAALFVGPGDRQVLTRSADAHKGDHGELLIVGGGPYTGAPALAGLAALRGGADLVRILAPETVAASIQQVSPDLIVESVPGDHFTPAHLDTLQSVAADRDSVVIGPGLGRADETLTVVREFLAEATGRIVVDADPLRVVPDVESEADLLCTPHRGEFEAMGGTDHDDWHARMAAVKAHATALDVTLLVKGPFDVISDGDQTRVNRTGNPGMTVGGTGDVLAGLAGALFATQPAVPAAAISANVNGLAGDRLVDERGYGLVASELPSQFPDILWQ